MPDRSLDAVLALSVLHLLDNKEAVISKIYKMLKPSGILVTSTACIGDSALRLLKPILQVGKLFGLMPLVKVFATRELEGSMTRAGFEISHKWQPGKYKAVFMVAKKAQ